VLLIGCANLANLLLARSAARRHEVGIRLAVGASRGHVARQLIVESLLLAIVGGVAGLVVAATTLRVLSAYQLPGGIGIETLGLSLNRWTLAATAGLSLLTGLLFGGMPAWRASRTDVMITLRDDTRGATAPSRLRGALVAAQVALSLVLLAGSGLFLRSLVHALSVPLGFNVEGVATASVNAGLVRYDAPRAHAFYTEALSRVRQLPGVTAAAWASLIPSNGLMMNVVDIQGRAPAQGEDMTFHVSQVGPEYFAAAGSRLLNGRGFTPADNSTGALVAVVSRAAAERFWPGRSPVGAQLRPGGDGEWRTIVGVVEDVKARQLDEEPVPYVFYPFEQSTGGIRGASEPAHLLVRTNGDPRELLGTLAAQLRSIDAQMPVYDVMPFAEHVQELVMPQRMGAILLGFFSVLALSLASIGIYGVASYVAQLRTKELGIRIALGADARQIRGIVLRHGVTPAAIGVTVGVGLAMWAAGFARAFLYDVSPTDPLTFTMVSVTLLLVAFIATWLPARRAAQLDPIVALRHQ
jgi:putative ABC transport system permease protein